MPFAEANGIHIYYEVHGEGEPLVLIGGLNSDHTFYLRTGIAGDLSEHYRVVVFDNRGIGRSDKPDIAYSIEMMADDTSALLDALGIGQAHILGLSMGGRIALSLALRHPEHVRSLILVSTGARTTRTWRRWFISLMLRTRLVRGSVPYHAVAHQRDASRSYDGTDRLAEIRVPTLILHGKSDKTAPLSLAEEMHARIGRSKLVTFGGGHLFMIAQREAFVREIEAFLGQQRAS